MLSWRKMRSWWARILILLTVALAVANAQCFAQCLMQPRGAAHCHQHGQTKFAHCSLQHELRLSSAGSVAPGAVLIALVELPDLAINPASPRSIEPLAESPPTPFNPTTPLPLRI
jgi:hypothetical protein